VILRTVSLKLQNSGASEEPPKVIWRGTSGRSPH
jgi:hypothetical protein